MRYEDWEIAEARAEWEEENPDLAAEQAGWEDAEDDRRISWAEDRMLYGDDFEADRMADDYEARIYGD